MEVTLTFTTRQLDDLRDALWVAATHYEELLAGTTHTTIRSTRPT